MEYFTLRDRHAVVVTDIKLLLRRARRRATHAGLVRPVTARDAVATLLMADASEGVATDLERYGLEIVATATTLHGEDAPPRPDRWLVDPDLPHTGVLLAHRLDSALDPDELDGDLELSGGDIVLASSSSSHDGGINDPTSPSRLTPVSGFRSEPR